MEASSIRAEGEGEPAAWALPAGARGATGSAHFANTDWEDISRFSDFLPQPYRLIDQLLDELLDDSFQLSRMRTAGEREARQKRGEEAAIPAAPADSRFAEPEHAALFDSRTCLCTLYDSLFLVAPAGGAGGKVVLLDSLEPSTTVPLLELEPGWEVACLASVPPPGSTSFTLLALVQRPTSGGEADRLLVFQLAIVSMVEETGASWRPILLSSADLALRATALHLSHDGRFAAALGARATHGDGGATESGEVGCGVQVFALPVAAVAETLAQAERAVAAGGGSSHAPLVLDASPPPPPPFAVPSAERARGAAAVGVPAVTCHFVMAPRHRAVGEALAFSCAGLYVWGAGSEEVCFYQLLPDIARPHDELRRSPDRRCALYPAALSASALNSTTTLLALGYADGSVGLWDTTLHVQRGEMAAHASRSAVRLLAITHTERLLSVDADGWVHVYDLAAQAEHGCGALVLRKAPLASSPHISWAALCGCLPLALLIKADGTELHLVDLAGDRIGRVLAPHGFAFAMAAGGGGGPVCRLLGDEQLALIAHALPPRRPTGADADAGDEPGDARARALAAPAPGADKPPAKSARGGGGAGKTPSSDKAAPSDSSSDSSPERRAVRAARLAVVDLVDAVIAFYPALRTRLGGSVSSEQLAQVLRLYPHEQRCDESAMPHPLLMQDGDQRGAFVASRSRVGSGKGSVNSAVGAPSKLARKQSVASSGQVARKAAAAATANGTGTLPAGAGLLAASGSRTPVGGGSMAAGRSIAADARSEGRSSVGSAASGIASKGRVGTQEYNDSAARVAKLLKARHYTRFAREARVTRRLDELAVLAAGGAPVDGAAKARAAGGGGTLAPKER
ncbi:hypothetical protein KFE25_012735 [Diacronema lutheri]|uniref:Uncharacterized protein n=1 Tax=Diacronema lutheri TaxID=2081491 RepID=A0A8J6C5E7_DIALT|nr:hypothetical protein KFE25_012735 [Diacronema lutheri]